MTKNRIWILSAVGVVVLSVGGIFLYQKLRPKSVYERNRERVEEQLREDQRSLKKENAQPAEIAGAMIRLSRLGDPNARAEALKRMTDPQPILRQAAASALGAYKDADSLTALEKLLNDADPSVRVSAIRALGMHRAPEREQALASVLKKQSLSMEERVTALSSQFQITGEAKVKEGALTEILRIARANSGQDSTRAGIQVASLAPKDPRVLDFLRSIAKAGKNLSILPIAINHLAAANDPWIRDELPQLIRRKEAQYRLPALGALRHLCPANRWELLKEAASDKDPIVVSASARAAVLLGGTKGKEFMTELVEANRLSASELDWSRKRAAAIAPGPDFCEKRAAQPSPSVTPHQRT